jgi:hypothetical protein
MMHCASLVMAALDAAVQMQKERFINVALDGPVKPGHGHRACI